MKTDRSTPKPCDGFTLIEIIVTIMVAAILAALMVQFAGTAMTRSGDPAAAVRTEADTGRILEEIVSDYVKRINSDPTGALAALKANYAGSPYVTMDYVRFDETGQMVVETSGTTDTLSVMVKSEGYGVTTLLTNSRVQADDPVSRY
jgi:prepilin-type N-terminal cleavage/methylation domain-containing protein